MPEFSDPEAKQPGARRIALPEAEEQLRLLIENQRSLAHLPQADSLGMTILVG